MPQTGQAALAASDISNNGWSPSPLTPQINVSPADTNWVTSQSDSQGNNFEVKLQGLAWPSPGPQTLTVRLRCGAGNNPVSIVLLDGNTIIASTTVTPTTSFQAYTMVLTPAQIATTTDYSNLRVQVATSNQVNCCPFNPVPFALKATVTNISACQCVDGHVVTLTWNSTQQAWVGSDSGIVCKPCGSNCNLMLTLKCVGAQFQLTIQCSPGAPTMTVPAGAGATCSPFNQTFTFGPTNMDISSCCNGTITPPQQAELRIAVTT
jgi:hypothetical protein